MGIFHALRKCQKNTLPCHPQLGLKKVVADQSALECECVSPSWWSVIPLTDCLKGREGRLTKTSCCVSFSSLPSTPHSKHTHIYFSLHLGWRVNCVSAANQGEMRRGTEVRQQILPPLVSQHSPLTHSTGLFYIHSTSPSRRSTSHVMSKAHLLLSLTHGQNMMEIGNKVHECIHTYTERNLFTSRTTVYFALKVLGVTV